MEAKVLIAALFLIISLGHAISEDDDERIYGGYKIDIRRAPYMASVLTRSGQAGRHCGGTILRRNLILTAAHCTINKDTRRLYDAAQCSVIVGTNLYNSGVRHPVRTVFAHPRYNRRTKYYDVGLLELNGYVTLSDRVALVHLARNNDRPRTGAECTATGYGKNPDVVQNRNLYQVHLNVISAEQCAREAHGGNVAEDNQHFICVKNRGESTCQGDSGGPLHDVSTNRQVGIVSHGHKDCTTYYPASFTRVTDVLDYITAIARQTTRRQANDETDPDSEDSDC